MSAVAQNPESSSSAGDAYVDPASSSLMQGAWLGTSSLGNSALVDQLLFDPASGDPALFDSAWRRLGRRLENPLRRLESLVSVLFDRELEDRELAEASGLADQVATQLGSLGFFAAADSIRRISSTIGGPALGAGEALSMATSLDEARTSVSTAVAAVRTSTKTGFALLVVGPICETTDEIIWRGSSLGLVVSYVEDEAAPAPEDVAAVAVVLQGQEFDEARELASSLRQNWPTSPIVAIMPTTGDHLRVAVAPSITSVLDRPTTSPDQMLDEIQLAVLRQRKPTTVAVFGSGSSWLAARLSQRGLDAAAEPDLGALVRGLASGDVRAVILTPHVASAAARLAETHGRDVGPHKASSANRHAVLRLIRTDPQTRSAIVVLVDAHPDTARHHDALRNGADIYLGPDFELDDLAVRIKASLVRRGETEPLSNSDGGSGIEPWDSAVVIIQRMLMKAMRRRSPLGIAVLKTEWLDKAGREDLDSDVASQFRQGVVVTRLDNRHLVVTIEGISRQALIKRMADVYRNLGLHKLGAAVACLECPDEGVTFDLAMKRGEEIIARIAADPALTVFGEDPSGADQEVTDVLIVDQDRSMGEVLASGLERRGLIVAHRRDGFAALDWLTGDSAVALPRVVLMDLDLRDIDGLQFLRLLSEAGTLRKTKLIVLAPKMSEAELQVAFDLGIDDFVEKPFSGPLLVHRIRKALG